MQLRLNSRKNYEQTTYKRNSCKLAFSRSTNLALPLSLMPNFPTGLSSSSWIRKTLLVEILNRSTANNKNKSDSLTHSLYSTLSRYLYNLSSALGLGPAATKNKCSWAKTYEKHQNNSPFNIIQLSIKSRNCDILKLSLLKLAHILI